MGRKLTDAEKAQRAVTRENNRRLKAAPLFAQAGLVELTNETEQRQRLQLKSAQSRRSIDVAGAATEQLLTIDERFFARLVRQHAGEEWFGHLQDYATSTYPSADYWIGFWREVLVGTRRVLTRRRTFNPAKVTQWNPEGVDVLDELVWPPEGWVAPYTKAQLEELYPAFIFRLTAKLESPDDGGLWQRVQAQIDMACGGTNG